MKYIYSALFIIIASTSVFGQYSAQPFSDDTLALVDRHAVTTRDLYERISMMPYEDKLNDRNFTSVKRKAVESLVGEYLLSQMSIADDSSNWRKNYTTTVLEHLFIRDALFRREIRERVEISESEIRDGIQQFAKRRQLLVVRLSNDHQRNSFVMDWRKKRQKGIPNEKIFSGSPIRFDSVYIAFGSADSSLESAAYSLRDPFDVIGPVQSSMFGTVAISLLKNESNPAAKDISLTDRRKAVKDILQDRKESQLQVLFFDKVLRGQQMSADSVLYLTVAQKLRELILRDTISRKIPSGYRFLPSDIYELSLSFKTQLDSPIVRGTFGNLTLGIFLEHLYYYDFTIPSLRPRSFLISFFEVLRTITEGEMVALEAERRGLRYDRDVQRDLSIWSNYDRSRRSEFAIADTVLIQEWEPYWSLWRRNTKVIEENLLLSVQEILVKDSTTAVSIIRKIDEGNNIDSLAYNLSMRKEWKGEKGISGWFSFNQYPELSGKLMMVSLNKQPQVFKIREGYSIVKLLGRKFIGDSTYIDSLLDRESLRMRTQHQTVTVNKFIASNAQNHSININYDKIDKADVADINMLTRRIIGFGGKINASPFLQPQWQWVNEWKKLKSITP